MSNSIKNNIKHNFLIDNKENAREETLQSVLTSINNNSSNVISSIGDITLNDSNIVSNLQVINSTLQGTLTVDNGLDLSVIEQNGLDIVSNLQVIDTSINNLTISTDNTDITSNLQVIQQQQKYTTLNDFDASNAFPTVKLVGLHPEHGGSTDDYHTIHATENGELKVNVSAFEATEEININDTGIISNLIIIDGTLNTNNTAVNATIINGVSAIVSNLNQSGIIDAVNGVNSNITGTLQVQESNPITGFNLETTQQDILTALNTNNTAVNTTIINGVSGIISNLNQSGIIDAINGVNSNITGTLQVQESNPITGFNLETTQQDILTAMNTNNTAVNSTIINGVSAIVSNLNQSGIIDAVNNSNVVISNIDTNINTLTQNIPYKPIQYYRAQGDCYISENFINNANAYLVFTNPSGSGVNMYIYNIMISVYNSTASSSNFGVELRKTNTLATTTDNTILNLKLDSSNTSTMKTDQRTTDPTSTGTLLRFQSITSSDTQMLDFQEEYIELPSGYSVYFRHSSSSSNDSSRCCIRWIETTDTL